MANLKRIRRSYLYNLFLENKYWFGGAILFFLLIAFVYLSISSPQYEVSAKIEVKNGSGLSPEDLRSTALLESTLDKLDLKVAYYKKGPGGKVELSADQSPIKVIAGDNAHLNTNTKLEVSAVNNNQLQITQEDTITYFKFNELIDQPFGKFRIVKGPGFNNDKSTIVLKFNDEDKLLEDYFNNYEVNTSDDDRITSLKIKADEPQRGIDFLNKLIQVYGAGHQAITYTKANVLPITDSNMVKVQGQINKLKTKADVLIQQMIAAGAVPVTTKTKKIAVKKTQHRVKKPITDPQVRTLLAIIPYVSSPVDQFVQIPYTDNLKDDDLKDMARSFNKIQLDKQRLLTDSASNDSKIVSINSQLAQLRRDITENINLQTTEEDDSDPMEAYKKPDADGNEVTTTYSTVTVTSNNKERVEAYKDSLTTTNKKLQAKMKEYAALVIKNKPTIVPAQKITSSAITIIEQPGDHVTTLHSNIALILLFAILAGLLTGMLLILIRDLILSISWKNLIDNKKLNEKLTGIFSRRQVD